MTPMRRRRPPEAPGPAGFLVVDKPQGWTSHDAVDAARRWLGIRKIGHLGTLDPLATGVLPLAIREATKLVPFVEGGQKSYVGSIRLGEETDTLDAEGRVVRRHEGAYPDEASVRAALSRFVGEIEQLPPMYSAVKRDGVPLHKLAREGKEVERSTKRVRIERLTLLNYAPEEAATSPDALHPEGSEPIPSGVGPRPQGSGPRLEIEVDCSGGTYVRALAADVGEALGCGAYLAALRRTQSGPFDESQANTAEQLAGDAEHDRIAARIIPPVNVLGLPALRLSQEETRRVIHGGEVALQGSALTPGERVSALTPEGDLVAVMEVQPGRRLKPLRVLRSLAAPR
jgi:tRNA pseudouridine55 synthase